MVEFEEKFQDIGELIEKSLDGVISSEETTGLDDCIVHDPQRRQYYCEYLHITSELIKTYDRVKPTGTGEDNMSIFEELVFNK